MVGSKSIVVNDAFEMLSYQLAEESDALALAAMLSDGRAVGAAKLADHQRAKREMQAERDRYQPPGGRPPWKYRND